MPNFDCKMANSSINGRPKEYFGTPQCFEMFGMDVMFDEDLRCWLLEFNALPGAVAY